MWWNKAGFTACARCCTNVYLLLRPGHALELHSNLRLCLVPPFVSAVLDLE